eukprot:CAMPEP_0172386336 /NCGR_PEP_ID=MMETSP1061-20121228/3912_1 /TAXON_ID=37318 /ORGANISM="Pseudo-nitzschia pungens, Strain cf. pungens" /LENGTH=57 /DNA_ID=CAMNT_0013115697 /DNA_START=14 /DNA_END=184 /DNA_ORIENTATION=+
MDWIKTTACDTLGSVADFCNSPTPSSAPSTSADLSPVKVSTTSETPSSAPSVTASPT